MTEERQLGLLEFMGARCLSPRLREVRDAMDSRRSDIRNNNTRIAAGQSVSFDSEEAAWMNAVKSTKRARMKS